MFAQAFGLHQQGQFPQAQVLYEQTLTAQPDHFDALHMLGVLAVQQRQPQRAVELIGRAVQVNPHSAAAYYNLGVAYKDLGQLDAALACVDRAIAIAPNYADAHYNRAVVLQELERLADALASYDQTTALMPHHAQAHMNRGNVLRALHHFEEALASYDQALALQPQYAEAHYNRGVVLQDMRRQAQALDCFDQAIACGAHFAAVHNNRANALLELERYTEAIGSYEAALKVQQTYADAHCNRAIALQDLKQPAAALKGFERTLALQPDRAFVAGMCLHLKMQLADWSGHAAQLTQLTQKIERGDAATPPFPLLALLDDPALHQRAATIWMQHQWPGIQPVPFAARPPTGTKIRLGYFSADFHDHATMHLMAELLELHDKTCFELFAFSFGPEGKDSNDAKGGMRQRAVRAVDHFIDVRALSDQGIAQLARQLEIDIAIDLKGYCYQARPAVFAHRAAPVQINYLGYPGTMAAAFMDYIVADAVLIPQRLRPHYTENVIYLPQSYQPNDRQRGIASRVFTRMELGLPEHGFVFCGFNSGFKITPATFEGWMRILQRVPGSVLWLLQSQADAARNLQMQAERHGVNPTRLVFAPLWPHAEHLARQRSADLFLDTFPCNAHTTASDALWAGLPVLTRCGESFASRVAASLLTALDLPELITVSQADFEDRAVALALDAIQLGKLRKSVASKRLTAPLFDTPRYVRHLEAAFEVVVQKSRAGLSPEHLHIQSVLPCNG
jgi:predicted O-linked N-acetylglucosamine transferase (SPINDLY family)